MNWLWVLGGGKRGGIVGTRVGVGTRGVVGGRLVAGSQFVQAGPVEVLGWLAETAAKGADSAWQAVRVMSKMIKLIRR